MRLMARLAAALAGLALIAGASDPAERLSDPAQEARARELFQEVRCLVCQVSRSTIPRRLSPRTCGS